MSIGRENSQRGARFEDEYFSAFTKSEARGEEDVSRHAAHAAADTHAYFETKYSFNITEVERTHTRSKLQRFVRAKVEDPADVAFRTDTSDCFGLSLKYGGDNVTIKQPGLKTLFEVFEGNTEFLTETLKSHARDIEEITSGEIDPSLSKSKKHKLFKKLIRDDSPVVGIARRRNMKYRQLLARVLCEAFNKMDYEGKRRALKNLFNLSHEDIIKTLVVHYNPTRERTGIQDPYKYFQELTEATRGVECRSDGTMLKFYCELEGGREFHFISCQIKNRSCSPFTSILGNVRKGTRKSLKDVAEK